MGQMGCKGAVAQCMSDTELSSPNGKSQPKCFVFFLSVCLFLRFDKTQHCGDVFNFEGLVVFEGTT